MLETTVGDINWERLKSLRATAETLQYGIFIIPLNFPFLPALAVTASAPEDLRDHLPLSCYSHLPSSLFPTSLFSCSWPTDFSSIFSPPLPFPEAPLSQVLWKTHTLWFPLLKVSLQFVWCTLLYLHLYDMQILWGGNYLPLHVNVMPSTVRFCFSLAQQMQMLLGTP